MSAAMMLGLAATMVGTSFLSGIFGMAGGMILMGILLALLSLPEAMALHAVTQMASNGWRGFLWLRYVRWRVICVFLAGCGVAFGIWAIERYVPPKPVAFLLLGVSPFLVRLLPSSLRPDPERVVHGLLYGAACMSLMLLAGVSGPLFDSYFLGGKLDRREIVATKAVCQVFAHGAKLLYFGGLVGLAGDLDPLMAVLAVAASIAGTTLARPVLERLSDAQFRAWANRIIAAIALVYCAQAGYMLVGG